VERWKYWLSRMRKSHNDKAFYLGMGDYHDFASTSESLILKNPKLHDDTRAMFDMTAQKKNRALSAELSFAKGNILGLIEGNHNWLFMDGQTSTDDLAGRLHTQNLGWLCHYTLRFKLKYQNSEKQLNNLYIVACHGKAGGKTAGITINQVDDLKRIFPTADIYIMGHDHQRGAWPTSTLLPFTDAKGITHIKQKRQFLARSGAFLKSYSPDKTSYAVKSLYKPSDLGAISFKISFHVDKSITYRVITDIEATI